MTTPLRVGIVDFLNSRPLAWGFLRGDLADQAGVFAQDQARQEVESVHLHEAFGAMPRRAVRDLVAQHAG